MRRVLPSLFVLYGGSLEGTRDEGMAQKAVDVQQDHQKGAARPDISGDPVALRWTTHPNLGFPRRPFEVWRRLRTEKVSTRLGPGAPVTVSGTPQLITWTQGEMYDVQFDANPLAGFTLIVEALDAGFHVIPGQRIAFTGGARGAFRSPGIAALRLSGNGAVADVEGNTQLSVANAADWERRQVVGLPFAKSEIALPDYDPLDQGYETPSLTGFEAALMRLDIARTLRFPLPLTGVADIPTPSWDAPDPAGFLGSLRSPTPALVRLIRDCLVASDDADPLRMQVWFSVQATLPGVQQADMPGSNAGTDPAVMELPVVAVSMLSAGSDSEAASALGYGTTEFWEHTQIGQTSLVYPPGTVRTRFDYMVTAPYVLPFQGTLDLAALVQLQPLPAPPAALQTARRQRNRAPAIDQAATEVVQVSWALSELAAGFGVLRSLRPGDAAILNGPRKAGGFDPFIPQRPEPVDGVPLAGLRTVFTDPVSAVPLSGSVTTRYMVLALDVFARWSAWRLVASTAAAGPVQVPGLVSAGLVTDVAARTGRVVPGTLEVDIVWDWSDRSPDRVELTGTFIGAAAQPPAAVPGSVPFGPGGPVVIRFATSGLPFIDSGHAGTVSVVPQPAPDPGTTSPEGDRRQYRLRLTGISCDFTSVDEVAFAVWVRGAETVRPSDLSTSSDPRVAHAPDPIPPPPPVLPTIDLLWTALPDATGRARGVLTWPAVAGATGYIVWEATEAALRRAVAPGAPDPPPTDAVLTRAGALRALMTGSADAQGRSLIAFSRMRDRPFTETRLELVLPGSADSLYAYRVSAITAANVESARSDTVALVAVPRRILPGRPTLLLRRATGGVDVIAVPGRGPQLAGLRVHRVRRVGLAQEVGTMGPAVIAESDPGWRAVTVPRRPGELAGDAALAVTDPVEESWYPYHYRVVAVGRPDPPNGGIAGESDPSAVASIVLTPATGPVLDSVEGTANTTNRVVRFRTDLPIRESPVGAAEIIVSQITAPAAGARLERTIVLAITPKDVRQGPPLKLLPSPSAVQLAAMPVIRRSAPDAQGRCTYSVRMRTEVGDGVVVVRDPLGRTLEQTLPAVT